jgi:hypothetical protein
MQAPTELAAKCDVDIELRGEGLNDIVDPNSALNPQLPKRRLAGEPCLHEPDSGVAWWRRRGPQEVRGAPRRKRVLTLAGLL